MNALKYASKFGPAISVAYGHSKHFEASADEKSMVPYFITQMITTIFCLYWDYNWDWGLFDRDLPGHPLLRDKLIFKPSTYYLAIVANTTFRFWWLLMACHFKFSGSAHFLENL